MVDFRPRNEIVHGHPSHDLASQPSSKSVDYRRLVHDAPSVVNYAAQEDLAPHRKAPNSPANVVCGVDRHGVAGRDNVDIVNQAVSQRHCKTAANHVSQNVVYQHIQVKVVKGAKTGQHLGCSDNPTAGTANARFGPTGLGAIYAVKSDENNLFQLHPTRALFTKCIQNSRNSFSNYVAGRISLWIASHNHYALAVFRQSYRYV